MENKSGRGIAGKQVSIIHLIYLGIIAIIVLAFFLVFAFKTSKNAGTVIGTASTVSSLILSVIAILMTIVDSAGQRDTATQLRDAAEKLQENLGKVDTSVEEIIDLKNSLIESIGQVHKNTIELQKGLQEILEKTGTENAPELIKEIQELIKNTSQQINPESKNRRKTTSYVVTTRLIKEYNEVYQYLKENMERGHGYGQNVLLEMLATLKYEANVVLEILGKLVKNNKLKEKEGMYWIN